MVFIDGSNLYHSLKNSFGTASIDIEKFCNKLVEKNNLIRIFYYTAPLNQIDNPKAYSEQQKFLSKLSQIKRITIFLGRLEKRPDNHKVEKGVDVKLAVDLLINSFENKFDVAYIVSNDSDFVSAITEVQNMGKKVFNVTFPNTKSFHLNNVCDRTIQINDINEFELKPRKK